MLVSLPPIDPELQAVGERLRCIREARGLSQLELAEALGVAREALAQAERGRLRLTSRQLYAAILALRIPMRLLAEPSADLSRIRRL
jgi:transcriptional regulator with XRE-family HTH domain